LSIEFLRLFC